MADYRTTKRLAEIDAAYIAGLIDGEGTIGLFRRHAREQRQLVVSTERGILEFVLTRVGTGKITSKRISKSHHSPSFTFSVSNRQALELLRQTAPYLRSYKSAGAELVLTQYQRLTPRNGKYTERLAEERERFIEKFFTVRAGVQIQNHDLSASPSRS
jgi:hypothetical protein